MGLVSRRRSMSRGTDSGLSSETPFTLLWERERLKLRSQSPPSAAQGRSLQHRGTQPRSGGAACPHRQLQRSPKLPPAPTSHIQAPTPDTRSRARMLGETVHGAPTPGIHPPWEARSQEQPGLGRRAAPKRPRNAPRLPGPARLGAFTHLSRLPLGFCFPARAHSSSSDGCL